MLNLLQDLKQDFRLTYMFISHDQNVVRLMVDRVMVMRAGAGAGEGQYLGEGQARRPALAFVQGFRATAGRHRGRAPAP